jgi:DNA-binding transcriptional ArsR family regulator
MAKKQTGGKAIDPIALFRLLGDRKRYRVIMLLATSRNGLLVGEIAKAVDMGHSATSHLLGLLNHHDLVSFVKEGRTVRYLLAATPAARSVARIRRVLGVN